jgi:hypothetical protein
MSFPLYRKRRLRSLSNASNCCGMNGLETLSVDVVETAQDRLVIGQA